MLHWKQNHLAFDDYFHNLEFDHLGHLSHVDMKCCTPVACQRTKHKRSSTHHAEVRVTLGIRVSTYGLGGGGMIQSMTSHFADKTTGWRLELEVKCQSQYCVHIFDSLFLVLLQFLYDGKQ